MRNLFSKQGLILYVLLAGCLALGPWQADVVQNWGFNSGAVLDGEFWRFLTSHFAHASWEHLGMNALGLVLLQQLFGRELKGVVVLWAYGVIAFGIGLCILGFGGRGTYIGLSGMLHGLFALGACLALKRDVLVAAGVLIVIVGKVFWEQVDGASSFVEQLIGSPVAIDAHLYGLGAGVLFGVALTATALRRPGE